MHCWKMINIEHQYGRTRIGILSIMTFVIVFTSSYTFFNFFHNEPFSDRFFILFVLVLFFLYPIHKIMHFISLIDLREHVSFIPKLQFGIIPIFHLRLVNPIPKNRYLLTLITPFIIINVTCILFILSFPQYTHYGTLVLAIHCGICVIDLLYAKHLLHTPKHAKIEETPRGYEILISSTKH